MNVIPNLRVNGRKSDVVKEERSKNISDGHKNNNYKLGFY